MLKDSVVGVGDWMILTHLTTEPRRRTAAPRCGCTFLTFCFPRPSQEGERSRGTPARERRPVGQGEMGQVPGRQTREDHC